MGNEGRENARGNTRRVAGIAAVGATSLCMLGLSIPLAAILARYSIWMAGALPLAILIGAGIMTARIWFQPDTPLSPTETEALRERVRELEERLANLEMIDSVEAHFANKHHPTHPSDTSDHPKSTTTAG